MVNSLPTRRYREHFVLQQARFIWKLAGHNLERKTVSEVVSGRYFAKYCTQYELHKRKLSNFARSKKCRACIPIDERFFVDGYYTGDRFCACFLDCTRRLGKGQSENPDRLQEKMTGVRI